ncbi:glucose dehydrogenase [FAD, quinone]-like [Spodoptera litura]|uniref:Glucose dehydrogenase [FAD, quinone]-like n=1 Tax=Spodoptera litura TaxID=69820 RepID=A0A9J7DQ48_SPOLT|nr:glucose dehydrogenase [FAD, quinone]-like [Spodoptera litura]
MRLKYTYILVLISAPLIISAYNYDEDDEFATVEDDTDYRGGRILWPYPLKQNNTGRARDSDPYRDIEEMVRGAVSERQRRFLHLSPRSKNMVVDTMMQFVSQHPQNNAKDPLDFLRDTYPLPKGYSSPLDEYDYVIVGGGTAGSVLAARLTEDKPKAMVLVIEAGRPESLLSDVPALLSVVQLDDFVWPYTMEHQPGICLASKDQRCFWPRGKALGGTSVINYMLYTRGRPQDWDRIAADGNYGWNYDEVLKYYIKSEKSEIKKYKNLPYRGRDGELTVENISFKTGLVEAFLAAGRENGHPTVDYNAPDQVGFGYVQATQIKGHRMSAAKAFLHPHKRRRNLHILTDARATKVIIDPQSKRAYAVEYVKDGVKRIVRCRREIILSAGPIASPQLLMLSGIGPAEHLKSLGIPVLVNLQVGRVLYDHIAFPGVIFKLNTTNASLLEPKVATFSNLIQWLQFGEGLLTTAGGIEGIGYLKTSVSQDPENVPDIELISMAGSLNIDSGGALRESWRLSKPIFDSIYGSLYGKDTWSAVIMLTHPKSKGYLELRDSNPFSHPKLYGNYLTEPQDMATMLEAIKHVIRLGQSSAFAKYDPKLFLGEYPACKNFVPGSDLYWECAIRSMVITLHHQIATCRMGPLSDPYAVVDPELRVYGVDGLRVVDSSVIPRPTNAHTAAPAIMIGEKGADLIKKTWFNVVS